MALSLSNFLYAALAALLVQSCSAATVTYNWNATWVYANPDGLYNKPTMGINGQWPLPAINITMGDRVIVNLYNDLGNETTSLHFHGIFQNGTTHMDGPAMVSQCSIPPGSSMTYNFTVDQPGTYWYHSHVRGQYPDGLRGPMLVNDPTGPYADIIDEQYVMTVSDHYHGSMPVLIASFLNVDNPTGAEPIPDSALMNDSQNVTFSIQPGKTYYFRIVNMAAFAGQYVWFEGHTMDIVEVDGVWTERQPADMIYIGAAQRYGVLITAMNTTDQNFAIVGAMDQNLFDVVPATLNPNVTGWLVYNDALPNPTPTLVDSYDPYDDFDLVPTDGLELFKDVSQQIILTLKMGDLGNGANYAFLNNISYVPPKVPTLYTALNAGQDAISSEVYGTDTHAFVLGYNEVIEIVLNNDDSGTHPFHLHGHNFQAVQRTPADWGFYNAANASDNPTLPTVPMRRDTFVIRPYGYWVIRFRSDNPGVWLFHCHIEWHVDSGLMAVMVEAPLQLQEKLPFDSIPAQQIDQCKLQDIPYVGNAAANTVDYFNLTGQNLDPAPPPAGFTARGIVALVFSCISAFLGMATIGWYGVKPLGDKQRAVMETKVEQMADE